MWKSPMFSLLRISHFLYMGMALLFQLMRLISSTHCFLGSFSSASFSLNTALFFFFIIIIILFEVLYSLSSCFHILKKTQPSMESWRLQSNAIIYSTILQKWLCMYYEDSPWIPGVLFFCDHSGQKERKEGWQMQWT